MTISGLRTFLTVAAWGAETGLGYDDVARLAGLDYIQAAHQLELLSNGRAGQEGLELVVRREEADRRFRSVTLSDLGTNLAKRFAGPEVHLGSEGSPQAEDAALRDALQRGPLPAIQFATNALPGISLGSFTVLLEITRQEAAFAFDGKPAKVIAEQLGISNFARHLSVLGSGSKDRKGFGLIEIISNVDDRRIKLPKLTAEGHRIMSEIAARVCEEERVVPKRVKPEKLEHVTEPSEITFLDDDDFDLTFDPE